jgi:hypothetical protein
LAAIVQVPSATIVTVLANTVQMPAVVDVNATASPDEAVAETVNGVVPNPLPESAAKEMDCAVNAAANTVNDCDTCGAALKLALPA